MPIWKISHGPTIFTDAQDKHAVAKAVTDFYVSVGLPAYYVNVQFYLLTSENFYTGGNPIDHTVFVEIIHIARNINPTQEPQRVKSMKDNFDKILMPYTATRNFHLEYVLLQGPAGMWRINGIDPPESLGPDEQEQAEVNRKRLDELRMNPS